MSWMILSNYIELITKLFFTFHNMHFMRNHSQKHCNCQWSIIQLFLIERERESSSAREFLVK